MSLSLLIAVTFLVVALYNIFDSWRRLRGVRRVVGMLGGMLVAIGGGAFFSVSLLPAFGGIPTNFEWPVGHADQIIQLSDGNRVAVHTPSSRLQVYDPAWHFVRGWSIDANGGSFKVRLVENALLEVWTARGQKRLVFEPVGRLVWSGNYDAGSYGDFQTDGRSGYVPTPLPLWIFAHPFIAWSVGAVGMAMSAWSDPKKLKRMRGN